MPQIDNPQPTPLSPLSPQANRVLGLAAILASLGVLIAGVALPAMKSDLGNWEPVACEITRSLVVTRQLEEPWGNSTRTRETHGVEIAYVYEYAGQHHESRAITPDPAAYQSMDEAKAEALAERYPVGAKVTALVNPDNPSEAALEAAPSATRYIFLTAGCIVLLYGLALFFTNRRLSD